MSQFNLFPCSDRIKNKEKKELVENSLHVSKDTLIHTPIKICIVLLLLFCFSLRNRHNEHSLEGELRLNICSLSFHIEQMTTVPVARLGRGSTDVGSGVVQPFLFFHQEKASPSKIANVTDKTRTVL